MQKIRTFINKIILAYRTRNSLTLLPPAQVDTQRRVIEVVFVLFGISFGFLYAKVLECLLAIPFSTSMGRSVYLLGITISFALHTVLWAVLIHDYLHFDLEKPFEFLKFMFRSGKKLVGILFANWYYFVFPLLYYLTNKNSLILSCDDACNCFDWSYIIIDLILYLTFPFIGFWIKRRVK
jgi:hypothetical protein